MEVVWIICGIGIVLLLIELLAPTGGLLAVIGALGLTAAGVVALTQDTADADAIGGALIAAGVLSVASFYVISRKVLAAHRDEPVRTGWEELIGRDAEVREPLNPVGQIRLDGALWKARVGGEGSVATGNRVKIESVDGLTLLVSPLGGGSGEGKRQE
jgi:membrane-bound serine protease (ClpP class)